MGMTILMKNRRFYLQVIVVVFIMLMFSSAAHADEVMPYKFGFNVEPAQGPQEVASSIQILMLLTVLSLAPSILIMMTSFTRIIIVLSFLRNALGTQQMPPNQVLIGLALFLTLFVMNPVIQDINQNAYQPYTKSEITQQQALDRSGDSIKKFMLKQITDNNRKQDLALFIKLSGAKTPDNADDLVKLPLSIIMPAFLISELTIAFKIGFIIYIPFLVIDMVVSSTLMSMGMMMLPPIMISLPFKILLFLMVDGWNLVIQSLVKGFG